MNQKDYVPSRGSYLTNTMCEVADSHKTKLTEEKTEQAAIGFIQIRSEYEKEAS